MGQSVSNLYSELSEHYDDWFSEDWPAPVYKSEAALKALLGDWLIPDKTRALDLTCGVGTQALALSRIGFDVFAMDISEGQIQQAKDRAHSVPLKGSVDFIVGDAGQPARFVDQTFDCIVSFGNSLPLLGSYEAIESSLQACFDLLNPDGLIMLSLRDHSQLRQDKPYVTISGNIQKPDRKGVWLETADWDSDGRHYQSNIIFVVNEPEHKRYVYPFPKLAAVTADEMQAMMKKAGFKDLEIKHHDGVSFPVFCGYKR